jgi:hypothetical protein
MQLSVVNARTITEFVPENLSALLITDLPTVGPTVRLCGVGDIGFSGRIRDSLDTTSDAILAEVAPLLQRTDLTFGNLETPLTGEIAPAQLFSAPALGASILKKSGFNLIHLANNHVYDYGQRGLAATIDIIRKADLVPLGVGDSPAESQALVRTDMNGLRIGWLGCGHTLVTQSDSGPNYWEFDEQELFMAVARKRADVDLLIVSIHLGLMYMDYPRPEHKIMAEKILDAGAHLILMHHAHVLQGIQVTSKGSMCCYNLGNFLFDWEEGNVKIPVMLREQNEGAVFHFVLDRNGIAQAAALPICIDHNCTVQWATGMRGVEILDRLIRISRDLEYDFDSAFKRQRAERHTTGIFKVMWFHVMHGNWSFILESIKKVRLEHVGMIMRWLFGAVKQLAKRTTV